MKFQKKYIDSEEIKAETLITCIDNNLSFSVQNSGIFSRNYSDDLLDVERDENNNNIIKLSRDGMFHILPKNLFFKENSLKSKSKQNGDFTEELVKFNKKKERIKLFFRPFDTEFFRLSFELEKELNKISKKGNGIITESLLNQYELSTNNKYINKIKFLLPFVSEIRSNLKLLIDILQLIFSSKVEIIKNGFLMTFIIHKRGLLKEEYIKMDKDLATFFNFLYEWFLPVEAEYSYKIKDYEEPFILGHPLIIDYNTHLK